MWRWLLFVGSTWGVMSVAETQHPDTHAPQPPWPSRKKQHPQYVRHSPAPLTAPLIPPQARELSWLLSTLDETISALRSGLQECIHLLAPSGPGSTLPLSTSRSEALKGFITRVGSRVTRGDMQVKMAGLPFTRGLQAYKLSVATDHTLMLEQLVDVGNYVVASLELLRGEGEDREGGDETWMKKMDPKSVMQMLTALHANMMAARTALKGASAHRLFPFHAVDPKVCFLHPTDTRFYGKLSEVYRYSTRHSPPPSPSTSTSPKQP